MILLLKLKKKIGPVPKEKDVTTISDIPLEDKVKPVKPADGINPPEKPRK